MDFLKTSEVARILSMGESTVRQWEREGRLKAVRTVTGQRLFKRKDVEKLIPKEAVSA